MNQTPNSQEYNKLVLIPLEDYEELLKAQVKLSALEQGGVDNWDWYDDLMENYEDPVVDPTMFIQTTDKDELHFRKTLVKNIVQCLKCKDVIESTHRHDLKYCKCGALFVDGGTDYLRRGGDLDNMKELSVYKFVEYNQKDD